MGTTSLGLRYPASTDNYRPHTDIQNLASDTDAQILLKGWWADGSRTSASGTFTTVETVLQSLTFTAVANVKYEIIAIQSIQSTVAADSATMKIRWATGPTVTSGGTQIDSKIAPCYTAGLGFPMTLLGYFTPGAGQVTVGATAVRNIGTGTLSSFGSAAQINTISAKGV